ncbi:glycosyltransferase family 2 protein [Paenibacillus lycopersici]|uniref:Glycosyltransferase family 2 protein n=1 Tax=Paenibacillus lycopersici TaxID=2704462 RepID=A0A6C0G6C4_9BACL|nr:glycosyltransferase family 2 protein [Paenibacillus lycopersici]QHT63569.1 glycosyltransferase family 2 protein [Paenibacillus lycopersici]
MLLGIHILACNEEDVLGRCLGSVQGLADEIVVIDTGSADGTIGIAQAFGARVVRAAWVDDFAAARNAGLDAARTIWVLVLDADEWLDAGESRSGLRRLLREAEEDGLSVVIENRYGRQEHEALSHEALRLFRADCGLRYTGVIHEQLVRPGARPGSVEGPPSGLRFRHDGYLPETMARKAKAVRNLRLIGKALGQEPDNPFQLYNKGVALCQLNKPKDAEAAFALACLFAPADAPYRASLVRDRAKALLALGEADGAAALLHREADRYADYPDVQLAYGDSLMAQRRALDARAAYEAALRAGAAPRGAVREAGAGSFRARCGLAAAEAALGRGEQALRLYAAAAAEAPRYGPALAGWAEQLQAAGMGDEAIRDALASALGFAAPGDAVSAKAGLAAPADAALLARVLGGIGAHAAALGLWREAGPLAPDDARACAASLAAAQGADAARALLLEALGRGGAAGAGAIEGAASDRAYVAGTAEGPSSGAAPEGSAIENASPCRAYGAGTAEGPDSGAAPENIVPASAAPSASPVNSAAIQVPALDPAHAARLGLDAALYGWEAGLPPGGELLEALSGASGELAELLAAVERCAAPSLPARSPRVAGVDAALPGWTSFVGLLLARALELGLLSLARRLSQAAPPFEAAYAMELYRHGYAQAAAGRLLQAMEERPLLAEENFAFGELLLLKGLYSEALAMFEAAIGDEALQERARLGAAFCALALAKEALQPWVEHASAAYSGGWPLADVEQLQLAMQQLEAMGWRTSWTAAQRRRMNIGETADLDYALHDRQE